MMQRQKEGRDENEPEDAGIFEKSGGTDRGVAVHSAILTERSSL